MAQVMADAEIPGASIAVFEDGAILWAKGYGLAELGTDRAVTAETRFQAASISKPVAAAAALKMVEADDLSLDDNVHDFLLSWEVPEHDFSEGVTLRRLLCHGAGLTVHGFGGYDSRGTPASLLELLDGQEPANSPRIYVDIKPNTQYRYSGGGYCVLQQMMIDVADQDFPSLMQELVLGPAGMTQSTYEQPLPEALHAHAAHGHNNALLGLRVVPGKWRVYPEMAAAGLWTTPSDLARFAIALAAAADSGQDGLLQQGTAQEMLQGQVEPHVGLGIFLRSGGILFEHGGSNDGFRCQLFCIRDRAAGAAVMTNSDSGSRLAEAMIDRLPQLYGWVEESDDTP